MNGRRPSVVAADVSPALVCSRFRLTRAGDDSRDGRASARDIRGVVRSRGGRERRTRRVGDRGATAETALPRTSSPTPRTTAGWAAETLPEDIVFSFFSRQSALVAAVEVNPTSESNLASCERRRDLDVGPEPDRGVHACGRGDAREQERPAAGDVRARRGEVREAQNSLDVGAEPAPVLSRVRILEGQRDGYTSILVRNPALAALARGVLPTPPADAPGKLPPPGSPRPARFRRQRRSPDSPRVKRVLLVEGSQGTQRAFVANPYDINEKNLQRARHRRGDAPADIAGRARARGSSSANRSSTRWCLARFATSAGGCRRHSSRR